MTIFLTGFMGTGKTTVGKKLAARLELPFVDTDEIIERKQGRPITAIFASDGEEYFRTVERRVMEEVIETDAVVATGGGMVVDPRNRERMRAAGPIICLAADADTISRRTASDRQRPLLAGEDPAQRIRELLDQRSAAYADSDFTVDTSHLDVAAVVEAILGFLKSRRSEAANLR